MAETSIDRVLFSFVHDGGTFQIECNFSDIVHTVPLAQYKKLIALLFKSAYLKENQRAIDCIRAWMGTEYDRLNQAVCDAHEFVQEYLIDPHNTLFSPEYVKEQNAKTEKVEAKAKREFVQFEKRYMLFFEKVNLLGGYEYVPKRSV